MIAAIVALAIVLIFTLPRHKVIAPFLLAYFSIPLPQVLVLVVHLTMHQALILAVVGRMIARPGKEGRFPGGFNRLDSVAVLAAVSLTVIFSIQYLEFQAFVRSLGDLVVGLGGYVALRYLVPDRDAVVRTLKVLAVVFIIQGAFMESEQFTYQNYFSTFGSFVTEVRMGKVRAQGSMGGLYAGAVGGTVIPLYIWLWTEGKSRMWALMGLVGAAAMVLASHASTSLMALGGGIMGLSFWPLRKSMRMIRLGIVGLLVGLHLVMNGPVWSLIEHVNVSDGNSSYHRYMLVDNCIRHFGDWWLLGYRNYSSWGFVMWDLCNQFVATALGGGLVTLVLFIMIYSRAFGAVGTARKRVDGDRKEEWLLWCLGGITSR